MCGVRDFTKVVLRKAVKIMSKPLSKQKCWFEGNFWVCTENIQSTHRQILASSRWLEDEKFFICTTCSILRGEEHHVLHGYNFKYEKRNFFHETSSINHFQGGGSWWLIHILLNSCCRWYQTCIERASCSQMTYISRSLWWIYAIFLPPLGCMHKREISLAHKALF